MLSCWFCPLCHFYHATFTIRVKGIDSRPVLWPYEMQVWSSRSIAYKAKLMWIPQWSESLRRKDFSPFLYPERTADHIKNESGEVDHYVVISSTIEAFARKQDYDFLVPLTAKNWNDHGFRPIIVLVGRDSTRMDRVHQIWEMMLQMKLSLFPLWYQQTINCPSPPLPKWVDSSRIVGSQLSREFILEIEWCWHDDTVWQTFF